MTPSPMILYGSAASVTGREGQWLYVNTPLLPILAEAGVSVYAKYSAEEFPVLFCAPHLTPTRQQLAVFTELDQATLCIRSDSLPQYRIYLQEYWPDLYENPNHSHDILLQVAIFLANDYFATELKESDARSFLLVARTVAEAIVELLEKREIPFELIFRSLCHLKNSANHLSNVGFYQAFFAKQSGMQPSDILDSTVASMLHHIGGTDDNYLSDDSSGLNKPTTSPIGVPAREAFRGLSRLPELSSKQLLMIYQYQERIDGKGGPVGLVGDEIEPWAKMLAIVDHFDELTCGDSVTPGKSRTTAMKVLMQSADSRFDSQLLNLWNETVLIRRLVATGAST